MCTTDTWAKKMDALGQQGIPFFCLIDFDGNGQVFPLTELPTAMQFSFHQAYAGVPSPELSLSYQKMPFEKYKRAFDAVQQGIKRGDSYLLNLTFETPLQIDASLEEIYRQVRAPYKVLFHPYFVCFSPETFIQIEDGCIATFPMKGTQKIGSEETASILKNDKERYEQYTITDLMRNDLSQVAQDVCVPSFQEIMQFSVGAETLIQTFTRIEGQLLPSLKHKYGSILKTLLPAGSISGAPKWRTLEWIQRAETHHRGYYTGIAGYFDGKQFDSTVLIRFIQQRKGQLFYKSGGGITAQSEVHAEYRELYDKIYLP